MRILFLPHRLPYPPNTGDKVRAYYISQHLAKHHAVTLGTVSDEPDADRAADELRQTLEAVEVEAISRRWRRLVALGVLLAGGCATISYFSSFGLRRRLRRRVREKPFDLLYILSSSMAQYAKCVPDTPAVVDLVDVDSDKWAQYGRQLGFPRGWIYSLEGRRLRRHEREATRRAACALVISETEAALLRELCPSAHVSVVPNGVDLEYFVPSVTSGSAPTLVFTGAMDYFPNVDAVTWFCESIFPRIRSGVPEATFLIVGRSPTPSVRALGRLPGVEVTGTVPDVRPFLSRAALAVAPLRIGRGVQNKVLEAMAAGLPVVATPKAHEGLTAVAGRDLFVEAAPDAFADRVVMLLGNDRARSEIGRVARCFVEKEYSWEAACRRLDEVIPSLRLSGSPRGSNS